MNFWWCNQGGIWWKGEHSNSVVCTSCDRLGENPGMLYRRTVGEAKAGDVVVHYRRKQIVAFSHVKEDAQFHKKLPPLNGLSYGEGWKFATDYFDLNNPIGKQEFVQKLIPRSVKHYPVNSNGAIKQAYFIPFEKGGLKILLELVAESVPSWLAKLRQTALTQSQIEADLAKRIQASEKLSSTERAKRLAAAPEFPQQVEVTSYAYIRNADVVVSVLERANGVCEECKKQAPFIRKKDDLPYLEVHHVKPLSKGGADTVKNSLALCPNCHRRAHYG